MLKTMNKADALPTMAAMAALLTTLLGLVAGACGAGGTRTSNAAVAGSPSGAGGDRTRARAPSCDADNGGLTLPEGFCALVVAEDVGRGRHLTVASNGDLYVALRSSRGGAGGGLLALRDTSGDGRMDLRLRLAERGGTGVALTEGFLYFAPDDAVLRFARKEGELEPSAAPETIVRGLPVGGHAAKSIALGPGGALYVSVGSPSNACQEADRAAGSPGMDPCPELETRAGVWRFEAGKLGQRQADGRRYATGLRNTLALAVHPESGAPYGLQHGRDQLSENWPKLFTDAQSAEKPSEEFVQIDAGDDFGWPYCYHDPELGRLVLAPEYGGDGRQAERCASKKQPLLALPAHWGPHALLFYTGSQFPAQYRGGAFVAFHGSWNRAPLPQAGYKVVFVPFRGGRPAGSYETFADGFAGGKLDPQAAPHRPSGLAQGPDGSLYVSDDSGGRIWRIFYREAAATGAAAGSS